jgi:L-threonylcarbamoyladenylate synthase
MYHSLEKAIQHLEAEEVVAIPTETVYGLAGKIDSEKALHQIFKIKERPFFDPLIVHVDSIEMAKKYVTQWTDEAQKLAEAFWPGPLTLVLEKNESISNLITAGLDRVGLRMPSHPLTLELISKLKTPLAAPSANKFKKTSPTSPEHVFDEFGEDIPVLDGGRSELGIESTVVGVFKDKIEIYRPGVITKEELQDVVNIPVDYQESPVAPGQLKHHYMPNIPITVSHNSVLKEDYSNHFIWELEDDPIKVARELYFNFRKAQKENFKGIILIINKSYYTNEKWKGVLNRIEKAKTYVI